MYKLAFVLKVAELNNKMLHHRYLVDNPESSMQDLKFKKTCRKKGQPFKTKAFSYFKCFYLKKINSENI